MGRFLLERSLDLGHYCHMDAFRRKTRKLLRDPRLFVADAIRKRVSPIINRPERPYVLFPSEIGPDDFSVEKLLDGIAEQYPVLHCIDEVGYGFGVLEKHLIGVLQHFARFAEQCGLHAEVLGGREREPFNRGVSEALMGFLRRTNSFKVCFRGLKHELLVLEVYIYRKHGNILKCGSAVMMKHLSAAVTETLWESGAGRYWPNQLLGDTKPSAEQTQEIDIVYTWVNSGDPGWREKYEAHYGQAVDEDRFSSRDELRYSLRSVHYYCDWVRNIYVVSNCAPPAWLDELNGRVIWVDHTEILPAEVLPTFNCHAIETGICNIPGLSEVFIYLNDDFFVTRPLRRAQFCDRANRPIAFLEPTGKLGEDRYPEEESWYEARLTGQRLLRETYGYAATRIAHHAPYVVNRLRCEEMFAEFPQLIEKIMHSKRRSPDDVPLLSFLCQHYGLATGTGLASDVEAQIIDEKNFRKFTIDGNTMFLCINDGGGSAEDESFNLVVGSFMEERFPFKAPWEC